jgi:hypothetical protein
MEARPSLFISPAGEPFRAGPGQPYPSAAWFARADANHDGRLDRAEMRADAEAFFRVLDRNHDGVVDSFEVGEYEQTIVPEILGAYLGTAGGGAPSAPSSGQGGRGGHRRRGRQGGGDAPATTGSAADGGYEGAAPFELTNEPEPVMAADRDLSGHITLAEFLGAIDRRFDELDKTHSGAITFVELPRTPVQGREPGRGGRKAGQGSPKEP